MTELNTKIGLEKQLMGATGWTKSELGQRIEDKISELGGFINDVAALHLLMKEHTNIKPEQIAGQTPEDKLKARILTKGNITEETYSQMLAAVKKGSNEAISNDFYAVSLIASFYGIPLIEDILVSVDTETTEWFRKGGQDDTADLKGIYVQQRAKRNKDKKLYGMLETTVIDDKGILKLQSWDENKLWDRALIDKPIGSTLVFGSIKKSLNDNPEYDDTYWWGGNYALTNDIDISPISIADLSTDYTPQIIEGVISFSKEANEWVSYDPISGQRDKRAGAKKPTDEIAFGEWYRTIRFTLNDKKNSISCRTALCHFVEDIMDEGKGLLDTNKFLDGFKVKVLGYAYTSQYSGMGFDVYAVLSSESVKEKMTLIQNTLEDIISHLEAKNEAVEKAAKESNEENKEALKKLADDDSVFIDDKDERMEAAADDKAKRKEREILMDLVDQATNWYMLNIMPDNDPNARMNTQTLRKALVKAKIPVTNANIVQVIEGMANEGIVKFEGAVIYPNYT